MGRPRHQLLGLKFGRLTVTGDGARGPLWPAWECVCECGNKIVVRSSKLTSGHTQSCGCIKQPNLTGRRFGRMMVLEAVESPLGIIGKKYWLCQCDCGNVKIAQGFDLRHGRVKSCGCLALEAAATTGKKHGGKHNSKDLVGLRFGRLLVTGIGVGKKKWKKYWTCTCVCGSLLVLDTTSLVSGNSKSCGCLSRDVARERFISMARNYRIDHGFDPDEPMKPANEIARAKMSALRPLVMKRDDFICQLCDYKDGGILVCHHIEPWFLAPDKREDLFNLITLCEPCHAIVHRGNYRVAPDPDISARLKKIAFERSTRAACDNVISMPASINSIANGASL